MDGFKLLTRVEQIGIADGMNVEVREKNEELFQGVLLQQSN